MIALVRRALRLATPTERRRLLLAAALGVLGGAAGTALLAMSGYLIARASQEPPVLSLTVAIVGVRGFGVVRAAARYAERLVGHDTALGILARLRAQTFAAVAAGGADLRLLLPTGSSSDAQLAGTETADRLVADVDRVQDAYLRSLSPLAVAAVIGAGALVVAAIFLPVAAAVLAGVLLAGAVLLPIYATRAARGAAQQRAPRRAAVVREIATALDAAPELLVAGMAEDQIARVHEAGAALDRVDRREGRATALVGAAATAVGGLGAAAVLAVALPAASSGTLDPVLVGMLALLVLGVGESIAVLPNAARELEGTGGAVRRVTELLDGAPSVTVGDPAPAVPLDSAAIRLRDVTVRRGPRTILRDIDVEIADGERVALVGPSGAGKSTLGELLVRFLPTADVDGERTIDDRPLDEVDVHRLRATVLHVPQDPYLFDADLRANLLLARPDASDDELIAAIETVGGAAWLAGLRDGLDTPLGERGGHLSGGERQRVGLARVALSRRHRLLLLDEPVSHLPPADGVAALRALLDAVPERGALLIAHRPEEAELMARRLALQADGTLTPVG